MFVIPLLEKATAQGVKIITTEYAQNIYENSPINIITNKHMLKTKIDINYGRLCANCMAKKASICINYRITPFKYVYCEIIPDNLYLANLQLYPFPKLDFPFFCFHLSKTLDDGVNAVNLFLTCSLLCCIYITQPLQKSYIFKFY